MIKINNVLMPIPSAFSVDIEDIDGESERSADGNLHRERLGVKRKLKIEYKWLTPAESSLILKTMSGLFFTVEYPDPMEGINQTKTFYVGNRSVPMYRIKNNIPVWENLSFNLVER